MGKRERLDGEGKRCDKREGEGVEIEGFNFDECLPREQCPNWFHESEYPLNFRFYPNGHNPHDGEIVGLATASSLVDTDQDILVWWGGAVVRMSVRRYNQKYRNGDFERSLAILVLLKIE